jgi:HK97 family phage portal protein
MGILQRWAAEWGAAVGTYQRSLQRAKVNRPAFLGSWAESERYKSDILTPRMAQRRAMLNSWVYTAVQIIMREASAAQFEVVEHSANGEPVSLTKHALMDVIQRPNPVMGRSFLWQYTIAWLQISGNAYWFVACDRQNRPVELWPLPAQDVEPVPGDEERFIDYYEYTANGAIYSIPAEVMVHLRLPNPFDVFRGLSPLSAALLASDSDTAMARWNAQFFSSDNVMPSAIINLSSGDPSMPINPADAEALKTDLRANYAAHRRKTAVTAANRLDVALLGWSAREMDFISGRQFTKEEVYSIYGIPGGLLDKNATEANATTADHIFKEKTIWPLLNLMAEQLTSELVWPFYGSRYRAQFDDIRPRNREMELQEVDRARGALTINEVRQQYWQLGPLPGSGGEKLYGAASSPALSRLVDTPAIYRTAPAAPRGEAALGEARAADLRRWRKKALKQAGKVQPPFASDFIPAAEVVKITRLLSAARTAEQVKTIFDIALKAAPEVAGNDPPFGIATVEDDPHRSHKLPVEQTLERELMAYFSGLEKRIIAVVQHG